MSFNPDWNPHYNFDDSANQQEIADVESYVPEKDRAVYIAGQEVISPWGVNVVIDARHEGGIDICVKRITVKPGYMLSLQRHRAREELWEVQEGKLTAILDGKLYDVAAGQSISMHRGAVHCMINASNAPVTVIETQTGICREKDNIRLLDFNGRSTYPLTSAIEYESARLYAKIQAEHVKRYGFKNLPPRALAALKPQPF